MPWILQGNNSNSNHNKHRAKKLWDWPVKLVTLSSSK